MTALALLTAQIAHAADRPPNPLAADEQIQWFPALATSTNGGWNVTLHGMISEQESRPAVLWLARRLLGLSGNALGPDEWKRFAERTRGFLADAEGGKRIEAEVAGQRLDLGRTTGNGHFTGKLRLEAGAFAKDRGVERLRCVLLVNRRVITNEIRVCLVPRAGISVVSDIDDTIKVTDVRNRTELLRNTFLRPFRAVDGMAAVYQRWSKQSAAEFHYVSGSPWQLFGALDQFTRDLQFPDGSWHLRTVRLSDSPALEFLKGPDTHKRNVVEGLFMRLPDRRFVLVGDSGERDPEIYGELARRYPERIVRVFIRDVTGESESADRYEKAFREVPKERWKLFKAADELPARLDAVPESSDSPPIR